MKACRTGLKSTAVALFWLAVWQLLAGAVGKELLLPEPVVVLRRLAELMMVGTFWTITFTSLLRILAGTIAAVVLGTLLAAVCCRFSMLDILLHPLLTTIKSTPVASFIILLILWIDRNVLPAVIVVLMVLPVVWGNVCAGIRGTDPLLLRTAKVFRFSWTRTLRRVYVPSVRPYFLSACRTSLGLAWKSGIAAEILTVPGISIGKMLADSKTYLETVDLFAWTLAVIVCSLLIENVLMGAVARLAKQSPTGGEGA